MKTCYNVLSEKWIPCQHRNGSLQDYGLLDMLEHATDLVGIVDPAPPIQFGLYRTVTAFIMDALKMDNPDDLVEVLERGQFDMAVFEKYVSKVGQDRFDLFDQDNPFLQTEVVSTVKTMSIANLLPHLPTGSSATHFHHWSETDYAFSPAVCARALASIATFTTQGGSGYSPSINGTPPWYTLVLGVNLFETLLLNCYVSSSATMKTIEGPAWRASKPVVPKQAAYSDSLLEGFTWRPRQVRLIASEGGVCTYTGAQTPILVRQMRWGPGLAFRGQAQWTDPNVSYFYTSKGKFTLRPQTDKDVWRDTGPLFLLRRGIHGKDKDKVVFDRPWIVGQFRRLREEYGLYSERRMDVIEVYGMRTRQMKVLEWQCERLSLPDMVARNPFSPILVPRALVRAETVAWSIRAGLKAAYPADGKRNKKAFERLAQRAQNAYWATLRESFSEYLERLAGANVENESDLRALEERWAQSIRRAAIEPFEEAVGPLDTNAGALRRQTRARSKFYIGMARALASDEEKAKRKQKTAHERGSA